MELVPVKSWYPCRCCQSSPGKSAASVISNRRDFSTSLKSTKWDLVANQAQAEQKAWLRQETPGPCSDTTTGITPAFPVTLGRSCWDCSSEETEHRQEQERGEFQSGLVCQSCTGKQGRESSPSTSSFVAFPRKAPGKWWNGRGDHQAGWK